MVVTNYKGKSIPKDEAVLIKGAYYQKGVEAIKYQGLYYRKTSNKVVTDHSTGKLMHIEEAAKLGTGVVGPNMEMGYFSDKNKAVEIYYLEKIDSSKNKLAVSVGVVDNNNDRDLRNLNELEGLKVSKGGVLYRWVRKYALNHEVAIANGFIESYSSNGMYKMSDCTSDIKKMLVTKKTPKSELVKDVYNLSDQKNEFKRLVESYERLKFVPSVKDKLLAKYISPYSFGLEFEVTNGFLPHNFRELYGVKGLRDGSVANTGLEYVTMPMSNMKGVGVLRKITETLSARCENDKSCSLHNHMGNVSKNKLFAVSLWELCRNIQDEVFGHMPITRLMPSESTGTIYCQKLPNLGGTKGTDILKSKNQEDFDAKLKDYFTRIYSFLNGHPPGEIYNRSVETVSKMVEGEEILLHILREERYTVKKTHHAISGNKWNRKARYYWLNMMPLYFSDYGTVEFRCHEATLNPTKTLAWLLFSACVIHYATDFKSALNSSKVTIRQILERTLSGSPRLLNFMIEYFEHRKAMLRGKDNQDELRKASTWIANDAEFTFKSRDGYTI